MDSDPFQWTVADVQHFFREEAADYISDMPHGRLPPLGPFLSRLNENDVTGYTLLNTIDASALRDDCGVASLGVRSAVLHCVIKLRKQSPAYSAQHDPLRLQTPHSLPARAVPPIPRQLESIIVPTTENVGEHVRSDEVQVQDAQGRKRRKLALLKPDTPQEVAPVQHGYLADLACCIDELFYGPFDFGCEIGDLQPTGDVLVIQPDHDNDLDDENFQFTHQGKAVGETDFVYAQMRHFMSQSETVDLRRRDRDAMAIIPYRARVQRQARSATVLQFKDDSDEPVAVRENAAYLESGYVPDAVPQQSPGEWDFLLQKHKDERDSEALPCYGESETGDEAGTAPSIDTEDDDDLAEESDSGFFNAEGVDEIIERSMKDCVANWQKDLPRLESKKASGVWKTMKQSRTVRSVLIEGAQARIEHLTNRLYKMKNDMLSCTWESEQSLLQRCGILEPTVQDREEQRWMIEVWRRTQEPSHTVQHGVKKNRLALQTPASHKENRGPILHPDDRFSVSPAKETQPPVENDIEEETRYEADDEEFHTPINSPGISPDVDADEWILPDEMDLEHDGVGHGELVEGETEGAPATVSGNAPNNLKDASSGNGSRYSTEAESESEELPESSTFVKQRKPFTPAKAPAKSTVLPIDLTVSSSDSSPPRVRSGPPALFPVAGNAVRQRRRL